MTCCTARSWKVGLGFSRALPGTCCTVGKSCLNDLKRALEEPATVSISIGWHIVRPEFKSRSPGFKNDKKQGAQKKDDLKSEELSSRSQSRDEKGNDRQNGHDDTRETRS